MLSRAARVSQRLPPCRTSLNQHFITRLASNAAADATGKAPTYHLRTAFIRSWRPALDITEQWTMIREVERKYGKVLETHFMKDYENPGKYQMMTYVIFADPKSLEKIPEGGIELTVTTRPVDKLHHEIGLEDMEHLVPSGAFNNNEPAETQEVPAADPGNNSSVVGFRLFPARMDYIPEGFRRGVIYQQTSVRTMVSFQDWGGFANLEPLDPPRTIKEDDLFARPGVNNQNRMRAALELSSKNTGRKIFFPPSPVRPATATPPQEAAEEEPSAPPPPTAAPTPDTSAPTVTPASVVQETVASSLSPKAEPKPTVTAKSEPPNPTTPQSKQAAKVAQANAKKTPNPKDAANNTPNPKDAANNKPTTSRNPQSPPKEVATPKPSGIKLPPPVQPSDANMRRKQPKPRVQPIQGFSRSSPISRSSPLSPTQWPTETTQPEPAPAEAPGTLSKLWGMLTGKRQ